MDKDNKENKNEFEPVEPLDITRRKSPDPSAETSAPAGEPQPSPSGDAEPAGGAESAADASAPAVPAPSDGEGAPSPSAKPPEKKGKKEKKEKQEKSAEEKAADRKRRLTLSGRIARSTLWYPLRITLFVLVKALTYLLNIFFTVLIVGMITGVVVGCAFLLYIKGNIDPEYDGLDNLKFDSSLNTTISYVDPETGLEQTAVTLHGSENRLWAEYKEIPEQLINAFIAIEDQRFYSHKGFDVKRTLGAVLNFIMPGGDRYGGSTITQQLIKVVSQDDDATIQRKVQEIFRAINVETKFSKEEILEMYLNVINLSQNCNGVKTAAQTYFGKSLDELTLVECAALAAIPKSPTKYDPIRNPEYNLQRRNVVLKEMLNQGKITQEEFDDAYNQPLYLNTDSEEEYTGEPVYSYFIDALIDNVTDALMEEYAVDRAVASRMLYSGGLKIVSTENPIVQSAMEEVFTDESCFPETNGIPPQSAMVVMDPHTGYVLGVVGGRGEKTVARGLNRAVQSKRQCGSSIKPLSVYALAVERGLLTYGTAVDDVPIMYDEDRGDFWPHNSPDNWYGVVSVSFAIQKSLNTVATATAQKLGVQECFDFLTKSLGFTTLIDRKEINGQVYSDIAISPISHGAFTEGVTVLEVTQGYTMFANDGMVSGAKFFTMIRDSNDEIIIDNKGTENQTYAVSEQTAYIMTSLLRNVVELGTGTAEYAFNWYRTFDSEVEVGGKTGQTNEDRDRYFVGFTPDFTAAVWFGYDNNKSLSSYGYNPSTRVWIEVFNRVYAAYEEEGLYYQKKFSRPSSIVEVEYCSISGKKPTEACRRDVEVLTKGYSEITGTGTVIATGVFAADAQPTEYCDCHVPGYYNTVTKQIVDGPGDNVIEVSVRQIPYREFFGRIYTKDQSYVVWSNQSGGNG